MVVKLDKTDHSGNRGLTGETISLAPNYDNDAAFYDYPDIFDEGRDRMSGEIRFFIEALTDIRYEPPLIDEDRLEEVLGDYERGRDIAKYILKGQRLVFERC